MTEATFGGVPAWLLASYLVELGGAQDGVEVVRGDGWEARPAPHPRTPGAFAIGRVTVTVKGPVVDKTLAALRKKAMREGD